MVPHGLHILRPSPSTNPRCPASTFTTFLPILRGKASGPYSDRANWKIERVVSEAVSRILVAPDAAPGIHQSFPPPGSTLHLISGGKLELMLGWYLWSRAIDTYNWQEEVHPQLILAGLEVGPREDSFLKDESKESHSTMPFPHWHSRDLNMHDLSQHSTDLSFPS